MSDFDFDALKEAGIEKVVITYSGSGDEGYIDDITAEPEDVEYRTALYDDIEGAAYDLLESEYAGWEINEGSHGDITLLVPERRALLHHGTIIESTEWENKEFTS